MELIKSDIEFTVKHKKKEHSFTFSIVNNLEEMGLDLNNALVNWIARFKFNELTESRFCEYIISKDRQNIVAIPFVEYIKR